MNVGRGGYGRSRETSSWVRDSPDSGGLRSKIDPADQGNLPAELIPASRQLARLLRYQNDVKMDKDGWVALPEVLKQMDNCTKQDIDVIVRESFSKNIPRFEMDDRAGRAWIRAAHKRLATENEFKSYRPYDRPHDTKYEKQERNDNNSRFKALAELHPDGPPGTPPPPAGQGYQALGKWSLDDDTLPSALPASNPPSNYRDSKSQAGSSSRSDAQEVSDPWHKKDIDPWSHLTQKPDKWGERASRGPFTPKKVGFAEVNSPKDSVSLIDLDISPNEVKEQSTADALLEVFNIGDAEDHDSVAAASTADAYECPFEAATSAEASSGGKWKDWVDFDAQKSAEPTEPAEPAEPAEPMPAEPAAAESRAIGVSSIAGNVWEKFLHEDESNGCWWWCEKAQSAFSEREPGLWTQYLDEITERKYWYNSDTEEHFFTE